MKKYLCLLAVLLLILGGCSRDQESEATIAPTETTAESATYDTLFKMDENGNILSPSGITYSFLAQEPDLYYLGDLKFAGGIEGEEPTSSHLGATYQTGMYAIKDAGVDLILIRKAPDNEWAMIYRDATLPSFDLSWDNCTRLELVPPIQWPKVDGPHKDCNGGITNKADVDEFLSELRIQISPQEAGLNSFLENPDGSKGELYCYGQIYGYFADDPNLVISMQVLSYNDSAYSVTMDGIEYVLPTHMLEMLINTKCAD